MRSKSLFGENPGGHQWLQKVSYRIFPSRLALGAMKHLMRKQLSNGQEWNASLSWALDKKWTVLGKLADYQADEYLADTRKLWMSVEYVY
jgi:hypothetical protein